MRLGPFFDSKEFGTNLSDQELQNFFLLCSLVLNFVRDEFGVVTITSGKRDKSHNADVGGVETSQHVLSEACDFVCPYAYGKGGMGAVFSYIVNTLKHSGETLWYKRKGHIHVALPRYNVHADALILDK